MELAFEPSTSKALQGFSRAALSIGHDVANRARRMIAEPEFADFGLLFREYTKGTGSFADVSHYRLRQLTDELGALTGQLKQNESFFEHSWRVIPAYIDKYCPDLNSEILTMIDNSEVDCNILLDESPNDLRNLNWPSRIAGFGRRSKRPPLRAYTAPQASVYIHPFRYQILSYDLMSFWETGSPRCLSSSAFKESKVIEIDNKIVLIQDRFDFTNLSHFIFDAITRVSHYVKQFGYSNELFLFGGVPGKYHEFVLNAVCEYLNIPISCLIFPIESIIYKTRKGCVWFSDQKEMHSHPAQMAHPDSIKELAGITKHIVTPTSSVKRLYVSRGDAAHRRVVNEEELIKVLRHRGFIIAELTNMSAPEQIALFRSSEVLVGPHGMGLSHMIFGKNLGRVIELFHSTAGTDAYSMIARSAGIEYDYLRGENIPGTHSDFKVDIDRVVDLLGPDSNARVKPNWFRCANLLSSSRTFADFVVGANVTSTFPDEKSPRMMTNQVVLSLCFQGNAEKINLGGWKNVRVASGVQYTASCWVWLPKGSIDWEVNLVFDGWGDCNFNTASCLRSGQWFRIFITGVSPCGETNCSVSLFAAKGEPYEVLTTCWQIERGNSPSSYSETFSI